MCRAFSYKRMNKVHYIDPDTRIRYRFAASLLDYGHVLERRRRWWIFSWWEERASVYDSVISGERQFGYLVEWLLWKENKDRTPRFNGYPSGGDSGPIKS